MLTRVDCFLDTNVLIYAALGRGQQEKKRATAADLIRKTKFGLSAQALQEFYTVVIRKPDRPLTPVKAMEWIEAFEQQPCVSTDLSLVKTAIEISQRFRLDYWDSAILAAAERLGAEIVYTEDLNHGQSYGSVRVINPFL
ncbi:MAG TPA: PIN domain-containing protein [Methyloceanibacter sp.]|jgi:predicted nucleic acid-binding protein|nr:PIN domain-containing protein [Methyloceanibacter sp.]